ncbi:hypothetical protein [Agrobacterium sp. NPDC089420]|uniref:hypothetical protein n=1 Tax=Agrobacterium sp. NPDC089420 TaxID=3363918 RepID=UPI00384CF42D
MSNSFLLPSPPSALISRHSPSGIGHPETMIAPPVVTNGRSTDMMRRVDNSGAFEAVAVSFFQVDIANKTIAAGINKATNRIVRMPQTIFRTMAVAL